jgi:hypothetical protein
MTRLRPAGEPVQIWGQGSVDDPGAAPIDTPGYNSPPGEPQPAGFSWQGTPYRILQICARWRVHTRWWEPDQVLWREYLKVLVAPATMAASLDSASGRLLCLLFCDLFSGEWFLARIYD